MVKLDYDFYQQDDVVLISKQLLGKVIYTNINNHITSGIIIETEAYAGVNDRASHAYGGKLTNRTEIMYAKGGVSYVYLCYGIHHLFNIVTNKKNIPHAILIRAIEPIKGLEVMMRRRGKTRLDNSLTNGPGILSMALGIKKIHSGISLLGDIIWIEDHNIHFKSTEIVSSTRIGIDYAKADSKLLWRFYIKNNDWVSRIS
tara:strand:+ start:174 stop:776 length:603 start_codon:yes stop_codon:yes gene_type:complete